MNIGQKKKKMVNRLMEENKEKWTQINTVN